MHLHKPLRVFQLEAAELDCAISQIFTDGFGKIFKYYKPHIIQKYEADLNLLLNFFIWKASLDSKSNATLGQQMLHLTYVSPNQDNFQEKLNLSKSKTVEIFLLNHIVPYFSSKISEASFQNQNTSFTDIIKFKFIQLFAVLKTIVKFFKIVTFLSFLKSGKYPTITERFLAIQCRSLFPIGLTQVSYDIFQREALWQGIVEFVSIVVPNINFHKLTRQVKEFMSKSTSNTNNSNNEITIEKLQNCSICRDVTIEPYYNENCGHVYCYFCIHRKLGEDDGYKCEVCGCEVRPIPAPVLITYDEDDEDDDDDGDEDDDDE